MLGINVDFSGMDKFVKNDELMQNIYKLNSAHGKLEQRNGLGAEMLGWMDLPTNRDEEEIERIKACAKKIQQESDVFVVVGIGCY